MASRWRSLAHVLVTFAAMGCDATGSEKCEAAGGRCVLGGYQHCAERGRADCNPSRNPGGGFCCLRHELNVDALRPTEPWPVASGASGAGVAAIGSSATVAADYACDSDADCAVKNVGNCCAYYPRCVNAEREIPAVFCPGGVSAGCGNAEIDACRCIERTCRSFNRGNEI